MLGVDHASSSQPQPPLNLAFDLGKVSLSTMIYSPVCSLPPRFLVSIDVLELRRSWSKARAGWIFARMLQICPSGVSDLILIRLFAAVSSLLCGGGSSLPSHPGSLATTALVLIIIRLYFDDY